MNDANHGAGTGAVAGAGADRGDRPVATRWPEIVTAGVLALVAVLVIVDSLRVGIGWADDGPRAGYFPFYIGVALLAASAWTQVAQLRAGSRVQVVATRAELGRVLTVLWPLVVYVVLIKLLGIYVASAILIGFFMTRHGRHRWFVTAGIALGVPLAFFLVFERWFVVPLPKGPLEALLGF
ncbi:MAG: tripartite tricarboxylate transporter TctB family protein [Pseudomonadota bacterium]